MKKYLTFLAIIASLFFLANCSSSKKASAGKVVPKMNYEVNMKEMIAANCSPCHFPAKGGNKKPFDSFAAVSENISEMLNRIMMNPGEKGYMPFKKPKLSDSTIAVFRQWRDDGMLEK